MHRYSGVEVRVTPLKTEIIIRATRARDVLGDKGRRIRELTSVVQKRFRFPEGSVELYAERVQNRGLCAIAQCESVKYELARHTSVVNVSCAQHLDPPWDERTPDTRAVHTEQPTARIVAEPFPLLPACAVLCTACIASYNPLTFTLGGGGCAFRLLHPPSSLLRCSA